MPGRSRRAALRLIPAVLMAGLAILALVGALLAVFAFASKVGMVHDPELRLSFALLTFVSALYSLALSLLAAIAARGWFFGRWRTAGATSMLTLFLVLVPIGLFLFLDILIGRQ